MAQKPFVSRDDHGGYYADCLGVQQNPDPSRTEADAYRWALDRLWERGMQFDERWNAAHPLLIRAIRLMDGGS